MNPYYYLQGPENFFADHIDTAIFKKNNMETFIANAEYFSKEVIQWFKAVGVTDPRGLIFRKQLVLRPNLHIDPIIAGQEWIDLLPKFIDKTVDYKKYVNNFAINWTYQRSGVTEWYQPIADPDDFGTTVVDAGYFAFSSYDKVVGPISTCYHTSNPILYNTGLPHVPVKSVDRITVTIRPSLNKKINPT